MAAPPEAPRGRAPLAAAPVAPPLTMTATEVEHRVRTQDAVLSGRVVDADTRLPVGNAHLTFTENTPVPGVAYDVSAAADGAFSWVAPEPGTYRLIAAYAPGYVPYSGVGSDNSLTFSARPGVRVSGAEIALTQLHRFQVRVTTAEGDPLSGAAVNVLGVDQSVMAQGVAFTTDAKGEVEVHADRWPLAEARAPGHVPKRMRLRAGEVNVFALAAGKAPEHRGVLAGVVVDPAGEPVAEAEVTARFHTRASHRSLYETHRTFSYGDGRFRFTELPPGRYRIRAQAHAQGAAAVNGRTGDRSLRLQLTPGAGLRGRVTAQGEPIRSFSVMVFGEAAESFFDEEGRYEILGLTPGTKWVGAVAFDYAPAPEQEVVLEAGETLELDFRLQGGGTVFGTVFNADTGAPLAGATVTMEGRYGMDRGALPVRSNTTTDVAGRFELRGVGSGLRSLAVRAPGFHRRLVSALVIEPGERLGPVQVKLSPVGEGERPQTELTGIGAALKRHSDGALEITGLLDGAGAKEAGLSKGDVIVAIDGEAAGELSFRQAIERIRGEEGSSVTLDVRRVDGTTDTVWVYRSQVRSGG